jgi:pimeloyl-ACP methyl ester carboxylesterase
MTAAQPGSRRSPTARRIHRRLIELPQGEVQVRIVEGSSPAIVFLHQTASASSSFVPVLERLRLPNRLIALDTPGFGGSFDPRGWPSVTRYSSWILAVLERLRCREMHLFGHHTGGSFALAIARAHPKRVRSVMILGPVLMSAAERRAFRAAFAAPIAPRADGSHLTENWNYAHHYNRRCAPELIHAEVVNMLRAWKGRAQAYRAVSFHDDAAQLRNLEAPLLLLSTREDYFYPGFEQLRAELPGAAAVIVGGENFPTLVDGAGVARAIEAFVRELASAGKRGTGGRA